MKGWDLGTRLTKKPGRPSRKGAALTSGIRNVRDNDIKLSCTLLHELCPILNMNFDLWRGKADSCLWEVAFADFNYSLYMHAFVGGGGERNKGKAVQDKQKFAGEQTDTDLIDLTDVYLLHCLVFCNLSQHTSISPSYHQHLERWEE